MAEYTHEYKNSTEPITSGFIDDPNGLTFSLRTDSPDRSFFNLGAGFSATISDGSYFYARYNGLAGYKDLSVHSVEAGMLMSF